MLEALSQSFTVLWTHKLTALWAMLIFAVGFILAFPVVRHDIRSLMIFPVFVLRMARRHLSATANPMILCFFIFGFNAIAIFIYMISGGLVIMPIVFGLFTGLNVGTIMLLDAQEPPAPAGPSDQMPQPRAWVGFVTIFVIIVELSAFWISIAMGITLGNSMSHDFSWANFDKEAPPRAIAYLYIVMPALLISAAAETAAIKAMLRDSVHEEELTAE